VSPCLCITTCDWAEQGRNQEIVMRGILPWLDIYSHTIIDDAGVTAIEYGLIAALVAVVCIVAWQLLGTDLSSTFSNVAASL
jgi:pilus assembly protein Flp/PilA